MSLESFFFRIVLVVGGFFWRVVNLFFRVLLFLLRILLEPFYFIIKRRVGERIEEGKKILNSYSSQEEYLDNEYSELRGYPSSAVVDLVDEEEENE